MTVIYFSNNETIQVLRKAQLYLPTVAGLGDPFLNRTVPTVEVAGKAGLSDDAFQNLLQNQYQQLPDHLQAVLSFEDFRQEAEGQREKIERSAMQLESPPAAYLKEQQQQNLVVGQFYAAITDPALWQNRGAAHQGVALEFDSALAGFEEISYKGAPQVFRAVNYTDDRPVENMGENTPEARFLPLLSAPDSQKYEKEWRLLRPVRSSSGDTSLRGEVTCYGFRVPPRAIRNILVGCAASRQCIEELQAFLRLDMHFRHVRLWQLQKDPFRFALLPVEVRSPTTS